MTSALVSATWLRQQVVNGLRNVKVLDASWSMSGQGRASFLAERISASAQHFDIDAVADKSSPYPHMLPSEREFEEHVGKLGVASEDHVIVYDSHSEGMMASPRVWWMFRVFGHGAISVLDGGLLRWKFHGFPTESGEPAKPERQVFRAKFTSQLLRTYAEMLGNHSSQKEQVVDARSSARFHGEVPEPRPELPSGGMQGALNLPYNNFLDPELGTVKSKEMLAREFQAAGVDLSRPLVASCGSGVTATHIALAAHILGSDIPVYDGSWTEWSQRAPPETMTTRMTKQPEGGA